MKTCPICKARCFDDMEICYGCMHRFETEDTSFEVPVEDVTGLDQMPFRPNATRDTSSAQKAAAHTASRRAPRRESSRVFGAVEDGDCAVEPEPRERAYSFAPASLEGQAVSVFEPIVGPLAIAPLGNGYRLVVCVERE